MTIPASYVTLAGLAAVVVAALLGLVKPLLELIPGLSPSAPAHDPTIRLLSLALNVLAAVGIGSAEGIFPGGHASGAAVLLIAIQSILQAGGSEFSYRSIASTAGSTASGTVATLGATLLPLSTSVSAPAAAAAPTTPVAPSAAPAASEAAKG